MKKWVIDIPLTMCHTFTAFKQYYRRVPQTGDWQIDLQSLPQYDSAGIAFLLWCIRQAQASNLSLKIINIPHDLLSLSKAQGIGAILRKYTQ